MQSYNYFFILANDPPTLTKKNVNAHKKKEKKITEPVPIPVTSLLGPTLCVLFGVVDMKTAFAAFANPMIFLFMGGFLIAKGMMVNGLDKRIATVYRQDKKNS